MKKLIVKDLQLLLRQPIGRAISLPSTRCFTALDFPNQRMFHDSSMRRAVRPYLLADIGEGITECQIISWFVKPGDRVEQFDRICEVQSDKASVEITSRWDGTIKALRYKTDDMAVVGQPLLDIDIDEMEGEEILTIESEKEDAAEEIIADEMQQRGGPEPHTPQNTELETAVSPRLSKTTQITPGTHSTLMIPSVRHMLKELDLNITDIQGTGKNGRVLKEDVYRYNQATSSLSPSMSNSTTSKSSSASAGDNLVSLTATQNAMFKTMTRALTIPHFLYTHSIDITNLNSLRKRINANSALRPSISPKITPLSFIMKALSQAFTQFPLLNSHLNMESDSGNSTKPQILLKGSHNFGIAVDTPQGLLVPVIKDVQNHSVSSLAAEIERISSLAQEGKLGVEDFKGATFLVSNIGSIGGGVVSPIIVPPMVGIMGIGRMSAVPVFRKNELGIEEVVKREQVVLSWSADHRVLDGATVARCAELVGKLLEDVDVLAVVLK